MSIAFKIKELAKNKNLSLKKIAEEIKISEAGFHKMLKKDNFWTEDLIKIAQCLDVTIVALIMNSDSIKPDTEKVDLFNKVIQQEKQIKELLDEQLKDKKNLIELLQKNNLLVSVASELAFGQDEPKLRNYNDLGSLLTELNSMPYDPANKASMIKFINDKNGKKK